MTNALLSSSIPLLDIKGDLSSYEVIYVYGIGDGAAYRLLRNWLKAQENRYLVFIEDDEELFLRTKEASWTNDPKLRLYFYQDSQEELFKESAWEFVFLRVGFLAHADYKEKKSEKMQFIFSQLSHYHQGINLLAADSQDLGVRVLKNVISNLPRIAHSLRGESLKGSCRGIPAIICGAGPSLNAAMGELDSLKDRALVFAGGSAATALSLNQVRPHFCAHFDPDPPYDRFLQQDVFEIPHFYQGRFSPHLLQDVHGALLWMAESGSYPIEKWIREELGIGDAPFDGGWTVANFSTAIAAFLGCSPIVFVGMDFCFSEEIYAGKMAGDEHKESWVKTVDFQGKEVFSKRDWIMSAEWLADFARAHPDIQWMNASEEGLELKGIERTSLQEIHLEQRLDLDGFCHGLIASAAKTNVTQDQVKEIIQKLRSSLEKCSTHCDELLKLWEKHYPKSPLETGEYALVQSDLDQEIFYSEFLDPLWQVWKRPILRGQTHPLGQHVHRLLFFKRAIEANQGAFS